MKKNSIDKEKEVLFNNIYEFCDALLQGLSLSMSNQRRFTIFLEELGLVGGRRLLIEKMKNEISESIEEDQNSYKKALAFLKFTKQQWDNLGKEGKDITFN